MINCSMPMNSKILFITFTISALFLSVLAVSQTINSNFILERTMCGPSGTDSVETVRYYDGLGRCVQTVAVSASPQKKDIISAVELDGDGRTVRSWNATPIGSGGEYIPPSTIHDYATSFYNDAAPYASTTYEQSAIGRTLSETGPGAVWHSSGRSRNVKYMLNISGNDSLSCRLFSVPDTRLLSDTIFTITSNGYYATGTLYVTHTTNEEGSVTLLFTDKTGRTVLERRKLDNKTYYDTYYVYGPDGNLTAVLPTTLITALPTYGTFSTDATDEIEQYAYLYLYDRESRCRAKKYPGCTWRFFVHDVLGRPIFSQDGVQRSRSEWHFILYDTLGRECVSGLCGNTFDILDSPPLSFTISAVRDASSTAFFGYRPESRQGLELVSPVVLQVSYYDDYSFVGGSLFPDSIFACRHMTGYGTRFEPSAKTFLTGELSIVLGTDEQPPIRSVYYYDDAGRTVQCTRSDIMGGYSRESTRYDFIGNILSSNIAHMPINITEEHNYTYDHVGRMLTETIYLNGGRSVTLSLRLYDELGRLVRDMHCGSPALSTEYSYNVRSWLTGIVSPLFAERLHYDDTFGNARYDGSLSSCEWTTETNGGMYLYRYDGLNRLVGASFRGGSSGNFSTNYLYDSMGNITRLRRTGRDFNSVSVSIDDIAFAYSGNRLVAATDKVSGTPYKGVMQYQDYFSKKIPFCYDSDGRLTSAINRGMKNISYNSIGLPCNIVLPRGCISFTYSSDGKKIQSKYIMPVSNGSSLQLPSTQQQNTSGAAFEDNISITAVTNRCNNIIYRDGKLSMLLFDGGYVSFNSGCRDSAEYVFYLCDHLGNNRMTVSQNGSVLEENHYYPDGVLLSCSKPNNLQPFKFNGKELDRMFGLDWIFYGARWYDPLLCRWMTVDPLCEKFYSISPYSFCLGNPVNIIDPDGREPIYNLDGKLLGISSDGFKGMIYVFTGIDDGINWNEHDISYWLDEDNGYSLNLRTYDEVETMFFGERHAQFAKNVINSVAQHLDGTKLFDDKTFTMSSLLDGEIKYSDKSNATFTTLRKHSGVKTRITFHGRTLPSYEGTVENFASSMLVHEWYSHGEYGVGSNHKDKYGRPASNHRLAYKNVMNDKIFYPYTTEKYKSAMQKLLNKYVEEETKNK